MAWAVVERGLPPLPSSSAGALLGACAFGVERSAELGCPGTIVAPDVIDVSACAPGCQVLDVAADRGG